MSKCPSLKTNTFWEEVEVQTECSNHPTKPAQSLETEQSYEQAKCQNSTPNIFEGGKGNVTGIGKSRFGVVQNRLIDRSFRLRRGDCGFRFKIYRYNVNLTPYIYIY